MLLSLDFLQLLLLLIYFMKCFFIFCAFKLEQYQFISASKGKITIQFNIFK